SALLFIIKGISFPIGSRFLTRKPSFRSPWRRLLPSKGFILLVLPLKFGLIVYYKGKACQPETGDFLLSPVCICDIVITSAHPKCCGSAQNVQGLREAREFDSCII